MKEAPLVDPKSFTGRIFHTYSATNGILLSHNTKHSNLPNFQHNKVELANLPFYCVTLIAATAALLVSKYCRTKEFLEMIVRCLT